MKYNLIICYSIIFITGSLMGEHPEHPEHPSKKTEAIRGYPQLILMILTKNFIG